MVAVEWLLRGLDRWLNQWFRYYKLVITLSFEHQESTRGSRAHTAGE